jgi:hypothetical protein
MSILVRVDPAVARNRLRFYVSLIKNSDNAVLQYNRNADQLRQWEW